ncbi:MAG TPA: hypothetical protein VEN81_02615 [Planctomycetota bacterium]|nr:hypothetical protein [Planctomycetota bacterium]
MTHSIPHPKAWRLLKIGLTLATLFSGWAAFGGQACGSCQAAAQIFQGKSLAPVGMVYYGVLLLAAQFHGPSTLVFSGVILAAGVHGGLLALLFHEGILCGPCLGAAFSALLALAGAIGCETWIAYRASWVIPGVVLLIQSWLFLSAATPQAAEARSSAERVSQEEFQAPPVPLGHVRMVVYTRPDCGYCIQFDRDVLPALVRDFGLRLHVERRSAENLPGIPTPTLILTGAEKRRFFPGLPELADLKGTVLNLMEESHGCETVFEKPR